MDDGLVHTATGEISFVESVLILVVVDDGLVLLNDYASVGSCSQVLILVVVDDGLVPTWISLFLYFILCLNPCCSGRWSRTRPYKTILIINKLKSLTKQFFTFLNRKLTFS